MAGELAILVSSHDGYADLWPPFFAALQRNWPDCQYPIYLLSNYKTFSDSTVKAIRVANIRSWPQSVLKALEQIKEEFVLLFLEDLFIVSRINNERFEKLVAWVVEQRPSCIRLQPDHGMVATKFPGISQLPPGIPYRSSTVLSLWRKDVLRDLLRPDESIWQFEVIGSQRTDRYPDFYVTEQQLIKCINGVIRGKWVPSSQKQMIAAGYPVQTEARPLFSIVDSLMQRGRDIRARALRRVPVRYQRRIRLWFSTTVESASAKG